MSLTYSGRKCDGWMAAFNRGSLLCLGATSPPNYHPPTTPTPPTTGPLPPYPQLQLDLSRECALGQIAPFFPGPFNTYTANLTLVS